MKKHVFWNNYFYLSSNRMIDVLLLKWGLECETMRLDSFNADNPSLCASNLPGNHTIHMFIIRADRRLSDSGNIGSVSAFTWWWRLLIKTSYLHHGQVDWKFCTNTVYRVLKGFQWTEWNMFAFPSNIAFMIHKHHTYNCSVSRVLLCTHTQSVS